MGDEANKPLTATPERDPNNDNDDGVVKVNLHTETMKLAGKLNLTTEDLKMVVSMVHYKYLLECARQYWTGHGRGYDRGALDASKLIPSIRAIWAFIGIAFVVGMLTVPAIRVVIGLCHVVYRLYHMAA
jgi:hypothetical protein